MILGPYDEASVRCNWLMRQLTQKPSLLYWRLSDLILPIRWLNYMRPNQIAEIVERQTKLAKSCLEQKQTLTQKYRRLRCLLCVKVLVICFCLGWSGSILQFRQNIIMVGSKSWLLQQYNFEPIFIHWLCFEERTKFHNSHLSLLYFWLQPCQSWARFRISFFPTNVTFPPIVLSRPETSKD